MALNMSRFLTAEQWKERNEQRNSLKDYFGAATELNHSREERDSWEELDSQKLSHSDLEAIGSAVIIQDTYRKKLVFLMKSGKPKAINWSTQAPNYPPGTEIALSSVEITKIIDSKTRDISFIASGLAL